jgi:ribosomal protein S18 acetylase RimI-like enzyme
MGRTQNNQSVVLKEITKDDLSKVAEVHRDSFPESALTKLGSAIVERYYLWQLTGPHENVHAVGAFVDDNCAGFSFSGVFNGSTSGFLEQNKSFLVNQVLLRPWLIFNSLFMNRLVYGVQILRRFTKKKQKAKATKKPKPLPFGILSIAVSNKYQNLGIGKILMNDAEAKATESGFEQMELTVSPENLNAVRFYEKLDWHRVPADENWKGYMVKALK